MNDDLIHIDNYFTGALSAPERAAFEARIESDPAFAAEVAFYISGRRAIREEVRAEKLQEFKNLHARMREQNRPVTGKSVKNTVLFRIVSAAAAACLLLFLGWQFFFRQDDRPQKLANSYFREHMQTLGVQMGQGHDSLQSGVEAYNRKDYATAEKAFRNLLERSREHAEATQYLGMVYLATGRYEEAISQFDVLSARKDLYINPGTFYKAVTLMKRSAAGDREKAKALLEEIARTGGYGAGEATSWLKEL